METLLFLNSEKILLSVILYIQVEILAYLRFDASEFEHKSEIVIFLIKNCLKTPKKCSY